MGGGRKLLLPQAYYTHALPSTVPIGQRHATEPAVSAIRSSSIALLSALMAAPAVAAQERATGPAVEGGVYDTVSGKPIPFAVISVAGTSISTLTNRAGRFRVVVSVGEVELEFRKIGFRRQSLIMTVADDTIVPDVFLTPLPVELATIRVTAMADDPATR